MRNKRFWTKVNKNGPIPRHRPSLGNCWVWTGGVTNGNYGAFNYKGKMIGAHRVSCLLAGKKELPSKFWHHSCLNPSCVRPGHLKLVSRSENTKLAWKVKTNFVTTRKNLKG